ncbi:transcriptional regulator [Flavobacterium poyangense]|uniref:transcriptional regulator n=1 Tax=Flavobacterium poyangense TaxID=2204302 RepID=UPI00141F3BEE|nr:tetratricopeptide repeat protein [Flavobacterium sp. JXAS1]
MKLDKTINKTSIVKIDSAYAMSKSINYKSGMLKSQVFKAAWYLNCNDDVKSCLKILKAIEPEALDSEDFDMISYLKLTKGVSYFNLMFTEEAKKEFDLALMYAEKIHNSKIRHNRKGTIYIYIGSNFVGPKTTKRTTRSNQLALANLKKGYTEMSFLKNGNHTDKIAFANSCRALSYYYMHTEEFDLAEFYINKSLKIVTILEDKVEMSFIFSERAYLYLAMKNFKEAIKNFEASNSIIENTKIGEHLLQHNYNNLALAYEKLGDSENQRKFLKKFNHISRNANVKFVDDVNQAVLNISDDIKLKHKEEKGTLEIGIIIISIATIVLIIIAVFFLKRYKTEKNSKEELKALLDEKMKKLNSLSDKFSEKDEKELANVVSLAISNDASFLFKFNELFPKFSENLLKVSPSLKSSDLTICSYIKLNFDTKEIARYGGDSVRSVESKKYRLRKKLNLTSTDDMNIFIAKF